MIETNNFKKVVLLFDEQGTPTFKIPGNDSFLGIGVIYDNLNEKFLFTECEKLFGLSNKKPKKNDSIKTSRAIEASNILVKLPVQMIIISLNLTCPELQEVVILYEEFGNLLRENYRKARKRPISQILHSQILEITIMNTIRKYLENYPNHIDLQIFIDDWSIPEKDKKITLEMSSRLREDKLNSMFRKLNEDISLSISPITLLNKDCYRKRFVDFIASIISRSFLNKDHPRFSEYPLQKILSKENNDNLLVDATEELIIFFRKIMDKMSRGN